MDDTRRNPKVLKETSVGLVALGVYEDETHVEIYDSDGWRVKEGEHPGEPWEALFYVAGVDEPEARKIEDELRQDSRFSEVPSGSHYLSSWGVSAIVLSTVALWLVGLIAVVRFLLNAI